MTSLVLVVAVVLGGCSGSPRPEASGRPVTTAVDRGTATTSSGRSDDPAGTGDGDAGTTATEPTPRPTDVTAPTTPPPPEEQARRAYLEAMEDYFALLEHPDPDDARLTAHHTGASLRHVQAIMRTLAATGAYGRRHHLSRRPTVTVLSHRSDTVVLRSCLIDDTTMHDRSGAVTNDHTASKLDKVSISLTDGHWAVSDDEAVRTWPDGRGCAR